MPSAIDTTPAPNELRLDFEHRQTTHCESGATANLLRYHGYNVSEPMAFGIGGGLFFGYFPFLRLAHIRITTFRKTPGAVFFGTMRRLGVRHGTETFLFHGSARDKLDRLLAAGTPVGCQVGLFWLPYVPRAMRSHFNAHNIVVYGSRGDTYLVSEPGIEEPQTIDAAALERARFAKGGMNPRGRLYWIKEDRKPKTPDLRKPIRAGLLDTCRSMLDIPIPLLGVRGIHRLAADILRWGASQKGPELRNNINQIIIMQEVVGSGGAGFRFMYAAFLQEASELLESPALAAAAREMTAIGDQWRAFALAATRFVKERSLPGEGIESLAASLTAIACREKEFYRSLRTIACSL